ncbi:hypothetical protein H257_05002 [Aphanomyces astaci]|uniref:glucan 1,3-beta-glucosidase n=1 Tax=Aphanomyces astaci TaxID=112090 RepID=W4GTW2_APHAT|nr:hypothetical protein H257_05002 [Aphanomyces astaci]ETV82343.1 hypothetical protein H257_05002 [Aphanomyces astaci]RQM28260.1 hypothetical protein B5M09_000573 [Aphanomyces astaci]|eukprot:XP_009828012.1 hypothetical protein H257_05002 [Aphanomyces astaci]
MKQDADVRVRPSVVILRRLVWFLLPLGAVISACILLSIYQQPSPPNYHMTFAITQGRSKVQGVNLAGWLVADFDVTPKSEIYKGVPEDVSSAGEFAVANWYTTQKKKAEMVTKFTSHRESWITEDDIKAIAAAKLNAVRVPIGYWIQDNVTESISPSDAVNLAPLYSIFAPGAVNYLDKLVKVWAKAHNISVLVDVSAALLAQNGKPSAAPIPWSIKKEYGDMSFDLRPTKASFNATKDLVKFIVNRYKDDDGFLGVGLLNEPEKADNRVTHREIVGLYRELYPWVRNITKRVVLTTQSFGDVQHKGASLQITDNDETMMTFSIWPEESAVVVNTWHEWHKVMVTDAAFKDDAGINTLKDDISGWTGNPLLIGSWNAAKFGNESVPTPDQPAHAKKVLGVVDMAAKGWVYSNWKHDGGQKQWGWSLKDLLAQGVYAFTSTP